MKVQERTAVNPDEKLEIAGKNNTMGGVWDK